VAGKHGRRSDDGYQPPEFGRAGDPEEVEKFDKNVSQVSMGAADKRLHGVFPYDNEPGSKPTIDPDTGNRRA